jgi:diguanylate cyclase (GGDEF)-like protein
MGNQDKRASETIILKTKDNSLSPNDKQGFLTVVHGGGADLGKSMPVGELIEIGRAKTCGLPLVDMHVSSRHARLRHSDTGSYLLEDLGSANGTRVNHRQLKALTALVDGDKIFVGKSVIRFTMADAVDLKFHDELSQKVHRDPLTGLDSKHCFDDALEVAFSNARRTGSVLSLLMMDMDGLKTINDTHGHLFGAYAIGETGRLLGQIVADDGRACRFGGDEFTAMLPGLDKAAAMHIGEKIRLRVDQASFVLDSTPLHPTISIGVACYPEDGATLEELIRAADRALYRAKRAGKNRVCA